KTSLTRGCDGVRHIVHKRVGVARIVEL
ncbi:MAG: hypothetical protein RJA31_967, partial [Actinomycetota bacterium]